MKNFNFLSFSSKTYQNHQPKGTRERHIRPKATNLVKVLDKFRFWRRICFIVHPQLSNFLSFSVKIQLKPRDMSFLNSLINKLIDKMTRKHLSILLLLQLSCTYTQVQLVLVHSYLLLKLHPGG